jgi:hypothetical protein
MNEAKTIFVTATKTCRWPPPKEIRCASCGSTFKPDVVVEDGHDTGYWVSMSWSDSTSSSPSPDVFCWGCASLFMSGDYRGASHDYELNLEKFASAVSRVVRRERRSALNPQESPYPGPAVEFIDHRLGNMDKLEAAHVVRPATFYKECRVGWPYS